MQHHEKPTTTTSVQSPSKIENQANIEAVAVAGAGAFCLSMLMQMLPLAAINSAVD